MLLPQGSKVDCYTAAHSDSNHRTGLVQTLTAGSSQRGHLHGLPLSAAFPVALAQRGAAEWR